MGKRELLIAAAFLVVGLVAYQLAAPPPKEGEQGFSLTRMFSEMRREIRGNPNRATANLTGTLPLAEAISELRLAPGRAIELTITAEDREDLAYDMPVESTGPDEATAAAYAKQTKLTTDDLGSALALRIEFPKEASQTAKLSIRVPTRLSIRLEGSARARVTGVRGVHLGNVSGEVRLDGIAGPVSGSHRQGDLAVTTATSVNLTLQSSRARLRGIQKGLTLNARSGETEIIESAGSIEITAINSETTVVAHDGAVQIGGEGGEVTIRAASRETKVDVRRTTVSLLLGGAATAPVTALTTDEPLRVTLEEGMNVDVDASASEGGQVQAADFGLTAEKSDRTSRLAHVFGEKKSARIVLRNVRGDIVIGKRK